MKFKEPRKAKFYSIPKKWRKQCASCIHCNNANYEKEKPHCPFAFHSFGYKDGKCSKHKLQKFDAKGKRINYKKNGTVNE